MFQGYVGVFFGQYNSKIAHVIIYVGLLMSLVPVSAQYALRCLGARAGK